MAALGVLVIWAGYTFGVYGFSKIKSAYGASPALSVADVALPSHKSTYLAAAAGWGNGGAGAAAAGAASSTSSAPSAPLQGPVAAGATGVAALGRTPPPSPTPVPSGPYTP